MRAIHKQDDLFIKMFWSRVSMKETPTRPPHAMTDFFPAAIWQGPFAQHSRRQARALHRFDKLEPNHPAQPITSISAAVPDSNPRWPARLYPYPHEPERNFSY